MSEYAFNSPVFLRRAFVRRYPASTLKGDRLATEHGRGVTDRLTGNCLNLLVGELREQHSSSLFELVLCRRSSGYRYSMYRFYYMGIYSIAGRF